MVTRQIQAAIRTMTVPFRPPSVYPPVRQPFPFSRLEFSERMAWLLRWDARGWGTSRTVVFLAMARQGGIP
jgi:hypothetical protein